MSSLDNSEASIPVEASARHVHLTKEAVEALFGKGTTLTKKRDLSQPGEFLSEQRIKLVTSKGEIANVAVLGPERKAVQVELSMTDCRSLVIKAPINLSGDLNGAGDVYLVSECGCYNAAKSVIVAKNHIHMTPADAEKYGVSDSQSVKVRIETSRPVTFEDVMIRVNPNFSLAMHIDFDEANACCLEKDSKGKIF
ncbi:MAG: phosphate propanoyltransferase [Clostridia bacterium]|nr:phosphate propanoyltransferase [Clostridia bacterium]